jgi:hypothetical protein
MMRAERATVYARLRQAALCLSISAVLQVLRLQSRSLRQAGEHPRAHFVPIMKGEHRIRPTVPGQDLMGTRCSLHGPTDAQERSHYTPRFRRRPLTHQQRAQRLRGAKIERQQARHRLAIL